MEKKEKRLYFITILVTLAALTSMVIYNFYSFYSNAVSNLIEIGKSSLSQEIEQLEGYLAKGMDVLQVTAISVEYMMRQGESPEEIEKFLLEESERYKEDIDVNFTGIYGLFQGEYLDGIGWVPPEDYVPREREWYIAAEKAGGKPVVVSPYLDAQTNTIMISVSQMLYDNDSVISLDITLDEVQIITKDIKLDDMGYGFVIDKEGLVVAHSDEKEKGKNYQKDKDMEALLDRMYSEKESVFRMEINGEESTVFSNVVMEDWYVAMIISNTNLYEDIRSLLMRNIFICVFVFALILYFCTVAFRKIGLHMKQAEESRQKVENMNLTIMRTLARTIDAKDGYTNGHSQRVARYAAEIAARMGKSRDERKDIYYAALLHDVGKIHIPDAIINKPSRLTEEEFSYIKLHPVSGYYILRDIREKPLIAQGAKWHHERYDGNGYPNGLSGDNIPEVARIIGVADAYDAMTSNRIYRPVMPQDKVRREFEEGKGVQFDPDIADIILQMIDEDTEYKMRQKTEVQRNILAVDDEPIILDLIESIFEGEPDYKYYKARSGKAALKMMKKVTMDLVLLDIQMPEMDGFEVYEKIRETSEVPIVFLTGDKSIETINRANALGVEDYLVKPFMTKALLEVIHSILHGNMDL